jgi:glycosyltransferase involved in cell wall biosynthesis
MRIFIHSCHAVLEYDQARMFMEMGHEVMGIFDVGSRQRPKIPGVTDVDFGANFHDTQKFEPTPAFIDKLAQEADVIIVHQMEKFPDKLAAYAESGLPSILTAFGQGTIDQQSQVMDVLENYLHAHVVAYSRKDYCAFRAMDPEGKVSERIHRIPFGKPAGEYGPWVGWDAASKYCLVVGNDLPNRGDACGWGIVQQLMARGLPFVLAGRSSDTVHEGCGEVDFEELKEMYRTCCVALNLGTVPAPYTLSLVEELAAGMPVIVFDNRCGIAEEELGVHLVRNVQEAEAAIRKAIAERQNADLLSKLSREIYEKHFKETPQVTAHWQELLADVTSGGE